jgi:DNA polymerase-1
LDRHEVYADYKANRPPMPDDLERQIPLIHELLEALQRRMGYYVGD